MTNLFILKLRDILKYKLNLQLIKQDRFVFGYLIFEIYI